MAESARRGVAEDLRETTAMKPWGSTALTSSIATPPVVPPMQNLCSRQACAISKRLFSLSTKTYVPLERLYDL